MICVNATVLSLKKQDYKRLRFLEKYKTYCLTLIKCQYKSLTQQACRSYVVISMEATVERIGSILTTRLICTISKTSQFLKSKKPIVSSMLLSLIPIAKNSLIVVVLLGLWLFGIFILILTTTVYLILTLINLMMTSR